MPLGRSHRFETGQNQREICQLPAVRIVVMRKLPDSKPLPKQVSHACNSCAQHIECAYCMEEAHAQKAYLIANGAFNTGTSRDLLS